MGATPASIDLQRIRSSVPLLNATQSCLDAFSGHGSWVGSSWVPSSRPLPTCRFDQLTTADARSRLRGQHIMVVGDMAARLWYSALVYLVNGTRGPDEVALGYPQHMTAPNAKCAWNPDRVTRGGYDFGGWGEFPKRSPCHLRIHGRPNLNDPPLTLEKSTGWWGHGSPRDVMTMLLKPKALWSSWRGHGVTVSYLWRGVVRTSGSYARQHVALIDEVAKAVGAPPTMVVAAVGAYDSQWQPAEEVALRIGGLLDGLVKRWPADGAEGAPLLLLNSLSSCAADPARHSVYMGMGTKHGTYRKLANASALIPHARREARRAGALFLDTSGPQLHPSRPALPNSPCHYDLPIGVVAEALVQIALNGVLSYSSAPSTQRGR